MFRRGGILENHSRLDLVGSRRISKRVGLNHCLIWRIWGEVDSKQLDEPPLDGHVSEKAEARQA